MFDENFLTAEFDRQGNFQMLLIKLLLLLSLNVIGINTIKIGAERICNCFGLSNVDAI